MLASLLSPTADRRRVRTTGVVGIDVGSRAIKWARLAPAATGWTLAEAHIVPLPGGTAIDHAAVRNGAVRAALAAADLPPALSRRPAACTLSMSLTDLRTLDLPEGSPDEVRQMAYHEIAEDLGESEFEMAHWSMPQNDAESKMVSLTALAIPTATAMSVADDLLAHRLRCTTLNALPYALARAATLAEPGSRSKPVAVLDFGSTTPSLTLVRQGRPIFARLLRDCSSDRVAETLAKTLQLSVTETWRLLGTMSDGSAPSSHPGPKRSLTGYVHDAALGAIRPLVQQLERTQAYLRAQFASDFPQRVWVVGSGALMQPLFPEIAKAIGTEVRPWQLPTSTPDPMHAVLAAAIGMAAVGDRS